MKKTAIQIITFLALITIISSCSTRKDRFLNRAMHGTATKYNVLYNGRIAYDVAKKQLDDTYEDDFFNILPIEPLKVEEKLELPVGPKTRPSTNNNTTSGGGFSKAEEKAVKAVQKHSMNIGGTEKNKQIDDAYFLLGKARYYDQRFVPALETFNYIIKHYPSSPLFNKARIWSAKCLTRLGNEDEAIYKLDKLLEVKDTPEQIKADALTALAMAYTRQDSTQMVVNLLDSTLLYQNKNHNQKARNLFILGQLYRRENKIDSSNIAFNKLANFKKAPYRFKVYSQVERAKNYNKDTDSTNQIINTLIKLSKNRDNRPYLDAIFYQLGKIDLVNGKVNSASKYFEKTLRTKISHKALQSFAYEDLGNIKFDQAEFLAAGAYYDSVLNLTENKNNKRMRRLIRKRKSLDEVIRLENISTKNDSILNLALMSKDSQTKFFKKYIKALKKKDEEAQIVAENKKSSGFGNSLINIGSKQSAKGGKFYFYNSQTVGFGQAEFKKIWGDRDLVDNWRLSDKSTRTIDDLDGNEDDEVVAQSKKYDLDYYLGKIPTDIKIIDSIATQRNNAYYKLGLIYKEKFKKDPLATTKLEKLLSFKPDDKLILPTYYHLYKAFESFDMDKSNYYKNKITSDYPGTRYAQLINNPEFIADETTNVNSPENTYKKTYQLYLDGEYNTVLTDCNKHISNYANTDIIPKFELLKAYAIAKISGKEAFVKALTFVKTNYPNLEEGIHAAKVLAGLTGETQKVKEDKKEKKKERVIKPNSKRSMEKLKNEELPSNKKMLELINKKKGNKEAPKK